ncbi:hypothetical protein NAEGRDRAFT_80830 [Naegleria gruberi]|uniref:Uncharacterized protein n=1 Tax=Naegleria gruberi TaxID=5762 RepID=D2VPY6_NAEGR|nr:uncharacterized protein NAEGRDRAFT_80830 [Naegleria gruberi]EFC41088.1 hypothetical protein NAEGRDRAFT_80830 [Naegleria gruberi]|eukprot:XP_002673832.1 hypothetical protein NAEGRDRAFT_80830 [Naegleria gruberi strain NEG-M]
MSNYHTNFYQHHIKTLLNETDRESIYRPCRTTLLYGSGNKNISLGIPMEEVTSSSGSGSQEYGGYVKRVLPCSCLIYKMRGVKPQRYNDYENVYGATMDYDDEFIQDISCGESSSCFLTSKGRVFTSANSETHDASKVPTFICLSYSDTKVNTNDGMVVELNLEEVKKGEEDLMSQQEGYVFGIQQVCVLSTHLCILTKMGLVFKLSSSDNWTLLEFKKKNELARIKYITSGLSHLMALSEDGELFAASQYDTYGACGSGNMASTATFETYQPHIPLERGDSILDVYAAYYRTLVVTKFGKLYVTGWGVFCQQGIGHADNILAFTLHEPMAKTGEKVIKVALGALHTICLCESGNCWAFGYNSYRQCGSESEVDHHPLPVLIELPKKIKDIFCGWHFSILQTVDGEFLGAGSNSAGELCSISNISAINKFTPLQLPKPPITTSQMVWRIFTSSFSSNIFFMVRLENSKRTQWMRQNMKRLIQNKDIVAGHPLFDIEILH